MRTISVLTIVATPAERRSSHALRELLAELHRRPDVASTLWFLRRAPSGTPLVDLPADSAPWVVDDLRALPVARTLSSMGLERLAGAVRGRRLRRLLGEVQPDVIVLDDGLGDRVLGAAERTVPRVVRVNGDEPMLAGTEEVRREGAAAWLVTAGAQVPEVARRDGAAPVIDCSTALDDRSRPARFEDPSRYAPLREAVGVPVDVPMVVGWGGTGWIDGPELFVRALWSLEAHHGVRAHGVWVAPGVLAHEVRRLEEEARRCGVGERFQVVEGPEDLRLCGDAVLLPYRCSPEVDVLDAAVAGARFVGFRSLDVHDAAVELVDDLDVDAAAAALATALASDRAASAAAARLRLDAATVVDQLLAATT